MQNKKKLPVLKRGEYLLIRIFFLPFLIFLLQSDGHAQQLRQDSSKAIEKPFVKKMILPGSLVLVGAVATQWKPLQSLDRSINNAVCTNYNQTKIDNFIQYTPILASFGLSAAGVRGRHSTKQQLVLGLTAEAINAALVSSVKAIARRMRPDSNARTSFPSGHTATAFCGAELLRMEYGKKYPGVAIAGYAMAVGTGYLRLYNKRHWFSDIVAGAGFGILSTRVAFAILQKPFLKKIKQKQVLFLPYINNQQGGLVCIKRW